MPKPKKYWGVEKNPNRHGRLRWYFRRPDKKGAPRIRLPDRYGSPEFEAAWRACMAGQPLPLSAGQGPRRQGAPIARNAGLADPPVSDQRRVSSVSARDAETARARSKTV